MSTRGLSLLGFLLIAGAIAMAQVPAPLSDVGVDQRLGVQVPLDLSFRDEYGRGVRLSDYLSDKPAILALVYYRCPMLCNEVLGGLVGSLKGISFDAGREFQIIAVSFDPSETPELARERKDFYVRRYSRPGAQQGWHFLTTDEAQIRALADAVGFRYKFDQATNQFAHAAAIMVLTPGGRLSHYFYGVEYSPKDLRLALVEASENRIGSPVDKLLLYCYQYDPAKGKYGPVIMNMVRLGSIAVFLGIGALIFFFRRRRAGHSSLALLLPLFPEQASSIAHRVDNLYFFLVGVSLFFAALVTALIVYFMIKYRRRSEGERGALVYGSVKLEAIWIVIPFAISMVIFVWGASVYFAITRAPNEALELYGIGKQWMWKFQHPDGQRELNELHIPAGRNIKITLASEDVIHSFYVPAFRIKADLVPGRYTTVWFKATKPGKYHLFCAEYCGNQHSGMIGWVHVMEPSEYQAWLSGGSGGEAIASSGERLFQQLGCASCHRSGGRGPALDGLFGRQVVLEGGQVIKADEGYLRESILNPKAKIVSGYQAVMPTYQGLVTEEQLLQLIAYIKSLGGQQPKE